MSLTTTAYLEQKRAADIEMKQLWNGHDCKASPESGCLPCLEYMEYFGIPDPEPEEDS